jgi:hypothetical protein
MNEQGCQAEGRTRSAQLFVSAARSLQSRLLAQARFGAGTHGDTGNQGDNEMDMFYIPALASFSGSASGTLASIVTGWVTQRRKDRVRRTLRATSQREELYKNFVEEASRLYADALVNDKSEVSKLVDLYALIARMKILSSDAVIEAAEKAGRLILDTYLSPNRTFVDLPDLIDEMDPPVEVFRVSGKLSCRGAVRRKLVFSVPIARSRASDVPLNQRINIRIHTNHK